MGPLSSGELRMSDGMSDRASRSASGRIPGLGLSGRDIGDRGVVRAERVLSERVRRAYARVHEGPTTVLGDLRSSRARASKRYVLALARIREHGYNDDRIRERPVRTGHTVRYNSCRLLETGSSSGRRPQ